MSSEVSGVSPSLCCVPGVVFIGLTCVLLACFSSSVGQHGHRAHGGDLLRQCVLCEMSHLCSRVQHKCAANTAVVCVLSRVQVLMTLKSCIIIS